MSTEIENRAKAMYVEHAAHLAHTRGDTLPPGGSLDALEKDSWLNAAAQFLELEGASSVDYDDADADSDNG